MDDAMATWDPQPGDILRSTAGRDAGYAFVVVAVEPRGVRVADGRYRPVAKPKRKNVRHVQFTGHRVGDLGIAAPPDGRWRDEDLRRALQAWREVTEGSGAGGEGRHD